MLVLRILVTICTIGMINIPANAQADTSAPSPEVLRELAYKHDFQALEKILDQLQQDVLVGRVGYDDQRDTYTTLSRLHPDLIDAVQVWREEMPDSNHARAARIWMLFWAGWHMRGEEYSRWIYPDAKSEFLRLHREALALAKTGFDQQPDFVPISDAVLRLKLTVRSGPSIWNLLKAPPIERIMELTPNRGSVMRRLAVTQPHWGGSFEEAIEICAEYAPMVRDVEGYTAEICQADALYYYNFGSADLMHWAQRILDSTDNPILDRARWLDAIRDRPHLAGAQERITKGLDTLRYADLIEVIRYDAKHAKPNHLPELGPRAYSLLRQKALAELEHNPNDPDLLNVLMKTHVGGTKLQSSPDWVTWEQYHRRKISLSPYNAEMWWDYASTISYRGVETEGVSDEALKHQDEYYYNAIVYSNYHPDQMMHFREDKLRRLLAVMPALNLNGTPKTFSASEIRDQNETMICPFIRVDRVFTRDCGPDGEGANCAGAGGELIYSRMYELARERNACEMELSAPIEELMFAPVEFDWASQYPFQ